MLNQLVALSLNGFTPKDIPFLFLQLSISAIFAFIIRVFWKNGLKEKNELVFLNYLLPFQIVFTTIAIFSMKSPWMVVLFGILTLIPLIGNQEFSLRSKVFYLICIFISFGCGAANLAVTCLVTLFLILPVLYFYKPNSKNE